MSRKTNDNARVSPGRLKRWWLMAGGGLLLALIGALIALYTSGQRTPIDPIAANPNRPRLVERADEPTVGPAEGSEAALKDGTILTRTDASPRDAARYEVTYHEIEQNFTANLADGSGFVQVGLSLATYFDRRAIANVERQIVPIRSAVLMVLSEQDSATLGTSLGKQRLQRQLTDAINRVLRDKEGFGGIDNVYFTSFVVQ
jgi:flagellar FliL protein